jgi:hypothetical protein
MKKEKKVELSSMKSSSAGKRRKKDEVSYDIGGHGFCGD